MKIHTGPPPCCSLPVSPWKLWEACTESQCHSWRQDTQAPHRAGWVEIKTKIQTTMPLVPPTCGWEEKPEEAIQICCKVEYLQLKVSLNLTSYSLVFLINDDSSKCQHIRHPQTLDHLLLLFPFFDLTIQSCTWFRSWLTWHSDFSTIKNADLKKIKTFQRNIFPRNYFHPVKPKCVFLYLGFLTYVCKFQTTSDHSGQFSFLFTNCLTFSKVKTKYVFKFRFVGISVIIIAL